MADALSTGRRGLLAGRPRAPGLLAALVVAALLVPAQGLEPLRLLEGRLFDVLSTLSPARPPEPGVVVVAIDEPSFAEVGRRWPWPRDLHGTLVERLREAGARVVGLDIVFAEPSGEPQADAGLARAMGPDVVLAADEATTVLDQGTQVSRVGPLPELAERGGRPGVVSVAPDPDGTLRRMPEHPEAFAAEVLRAAGLPVADAPPGSLIQYFGGPRSYPTVSYYQALDPRAFLPPERFRDRIVLVGLSLQTPPAPDSGAADAFATPYTLAGRGLTAGVEAHATILDNLRHGLFIRPAPAWCASAAILAAALLAAGLSGRRVTWRTGLAAALTTVGLAAASWALLRYGRVWGPPALPVAAALAVFGARAGLDFAEERTLRRSISAAFAQYLAPELVERLARDPGALKLGGERRTLSILFCDIRGFTTLSEALKDEPERLTDLVHRLLDPLTEAVLAHGGTIDKYIGDCVMAFWNAPLADPDHPARAVEAALAMIVAVEEVNAALARESGGSAPRFAVGVGLNTGDCVVGNLGSRRRFTYTALGDPVNVAARLEGMCKEYGVPLVIGPDTADAVRDRFVLLELDRAAVRGREGAMALYTALGPASLRDDPRVAVQVQAHEALLAAAEAGDAAAAEPLLALCRRVNPGLAKVYDRLERRLASPGLERDDAA